MFHNAYILVRCNITIIRNQGTHVEFKNCAPFTKCITKSDGTTIEDTADLDLVMAMYNRIEYSSNITNTNNFKSFMYKTKSL